MMGGARLMVESMLVNSAALEPYHRRISSNVLRPAV